MLLTKESVFPYGKYKNINILLVMNSMFGVNYIKWWDKKVTAHPFNDEIKSFTIILSCVCMICLFIC